jgi:hypothetical protein
MEHPSVPHNVVALKAGTKNADLLPSMRSATLQHIPPLLADVLSRADDALFDLVQKSHSTFEQQQFFDAMRELRRQRGAIEQRFREHFVDAFAGIERRRPIVAHYAQPGETSNELSLLDEEELEEQLAAEQVAQAIERRHANILPILDKQLSQLTGVEINNRVNPVGPGHMAASMRAGLRQCDLAGSARLVLFKLYEQSILPALGPFYADLQRRFAAAGITGGAAVPAAAKPAAAATPADATTRPAARSEEHVRDDLFAALHGLLEDYRAVQRGAAQGGYAQGEAGAAQGLGWGGGAPGAERSNLPPLAPTETLSVLSLLQRELPQGVYAAVDDPKQSLAGQLKRELMAQAERMGVGTPGAPLAPQDEDAIDLVGMLFEVLLAERKFQSQVRQLFTHLIVPFTKVAMLDRRMFMHKTHPARRMLNAVAEACDGNTGESALERELLERVQGLVDRLVAEFNEDVAIFEQLQEEFGSFLEQHRKRVELAERRAAEAQRGRERLEQARAVASMELAMLMGAREAPPAIDGFLRRYWTHHLAVVILRDGADSPRFAAARESGERLWSVMLAAESGAAASEPLAPIVDPVLISSGVTGPAAAEIVQAVESLLAALRRGDRGSAQNIVLPGQAAAATPAEGMDSVPLPPLPPMTGESKVVTLRPATPPVQIHTEDAVAPAPVKPQIIERGVSAHFAAFWENGEAGTAESKPTNPEAAKPTLEVVGGTDTIAADPADVEKIRKLEVGSWVEMVGEDGLPQPAKLSWVSPISSRLLFVNRRGMRVCAASAEELAVMLKEGKLSLREIDTAFERAMTQVLGKLRESAQGRRASPG